MDFLSLDVFRIRDADVLKRSYVRYRALIHEAILAGRKGRVSVM